MTMHGDAANTKACAKVLVHQWIARWGGYQTSSHQTVGLNSPGIFDGKFADLWATTSYHLQHNGNVERMHRCLKKSLRARLLGRANWLAELPWVMFNNQHCLGCWCRKRAEQQSGCRKRAGQQSGCRTILS